MNARGFTLLELLVAMAIFALIGVGAYTSLFAVLDARAATRAQSERLAAVQYAVETFVDDLGQAVDRPVRALQPERRAPLYAPGPDIDPLLTVTRGGWPNPARLPRSTLARVTWELEEGRLYRSTRSRPDAPQSVEPVRRRLLDDVADLRLRFLRASGRWTERWPPLNVTGELGLPRAVEVTFELGDWGEVRRLIALPGGVGAPGRGTAAAGDA